MKMPDKVKPCKDEDFYRTWSIDHDFCQACGIPAAQAAILRWPGLSTHHICKFKRSHEACNLLRCCQRDHDLAEGKVIRVDGVPLPKLTLGIILTIKFTREPEEWDGDRLRALFGRELPECEAIPQFLVDEYRRWRGRSR